MKFEWCLSIIWIYTIYSLKLKSTIDVSDMIELLCLIVTSLILYLPGVASEKIPLEFYTQR